MSMKKPQLQFYYKSVFKKSNYIKFKINITVSRET